MMENRSPIKLLIADDHKVVLDGIVALLQHEPDFLIGATAHNGREVLDLIRLDFYDICLLDINMPEMDGIETAHHIKETRPEIRIIILTTYNEKEIIDRLIQIGVAGYLLKNSTRQELVGAIKKVADNGYAFSDEVQASILNNYAEPERQRKTPEIILTQREIEILKLLAKEYTNDKIASLLHISFRTVETHRKNMMHKTGATNLAGLLGYGYGQGLI